MDTLFEGRWKTLGAAVHWYWHADYQPRAVPLPLTHTSSYISSHAAGSETYPRDELVDAIDRRAGRYDPDIWQRERMTPALLALAVYDPLMADVVNVLCINGRARVIPGSRVRHYSHEAMVNEAPFEGDIRKLLAWLVLAWQFLGVVLATPKQLADAIKAGAAAPWALRWCRERGLLA